MVNNENSIVFKTIIAIGLVIAVIGFGFHFATPSTTRSGFAMLVQPDETAVDPIILNLSEEEYFFGIEMLGPEQTASSYCTVYIMNGTEYERYSTGTSLEEVKALLSFSNRSRETLEMTVSGDVEFYIVIVNNQTELATWGYYYVALPTSFYTTFSIGFIGVFIVLFGCIMLTSGWKRYFGIGLSVNLVLFSIRVFTLASYSLGLTNFFWYFSHLELYNDYQYFYLSWIPSFSEGGWAYSADVYYYLYPPFWLYTMSILGTWPSWLPGLILFMFNVSTGVIVYKISQTLTHDEKRSIFAMLLYLINPFTLLYGSFMWLNPIPFVFFVALSFYFAIEEKPMMAVVTLAVATLFKQFGLVLFPIMILFLLRRNTGTYTRQSVKDFFLYSSIYAGILVLVSVPFLIVSWDNYIGQVLFSSRGSWAVVGTFIPADWVPTHFNSFFLWIGAPQWLTYAFAFMLYNYIIIAIFGITGYLLYASFKPTELSVKNINRTLVVKALIWSFLIIMMIQSFFPRGSYKFYLLAITPFVSVLFDYNDFSLTNASFQFKKKHLLFLLLSWGIILCYRFVYQWIVIGWAWFVLWRSGELSRISCRTRKFFSTFNRSSEIMEDPYSIYDEIYSDE